MEVDRHEDIIGEGDRPDDVHLLVEGWACRYKLRPDGQRQIMAYLIPGDLCDTHVFLLKVMDHSIGALTRCKVAFIPRRNITEITETCPRLARALWWSTLVDEATLREWIVSLGRRPADKRIAHLFCEMLLRAQAVGLTSDDSFELPLTQEELADTMGLSIVHVNRVLQQFRSEGLITFESKRLTINDLERLMEIGEFDPSYLHLENGGRKDGGTDRKGGEGAVSRR